ncbi:hypothetical protein BaRGS_00037645 [Batillaria attramentaria]|uniref:Galactose mutarotase n=1 Tax=Batillaria attramentaria TaxID=370345 RepID=A0ABD0J812_9CAEN
MSWRVFPGSTADFTMRDATSIPSVVTGVSENRDGISETHQEEVYTSPTPKNEFPSSTVWNDVQRGGDRSHSPHIHDSTSVQQVPSDVACLESITDSTVNFLIDCSLPLVVKQMNPVTEKLVTVWTDKYGCLGTVVNSLSKKVLTTVWGVDVCLRLSFDIVPRLLQVNFFDNFGWANQPPVNAVKLYYYETLLVEVPDMHVLYTSVSVVDAGIDVPDQPCDFYCTAVVELISYRSRLLSVNGCGYELPLRKRARRPPSVEFRVFTNTKCGNFKMVYAIFPKPRKDEVRLLNCSAVPRVVLDDLFVCDMEVDCEGATDEHNCSYSKSACPGMIESGQKCFSVFRAELANWKTALSACEKHSLSLAMAKTPKEWDALVSSFNISNMFIGLKAVEVSGDLAPAAGAPIVLASAVYKNIWRWADGTIAYNLIPVNQSVSLSSCAMVVSENPVTDCQDGTDEDFCVFGKCSEYKCQSNQCIPKSKSCDGVFDCIDGSDETCQKDHIQTHVQTTSFTPALGTTMSQWIVVFLVIATAAVVGMPAPEPGLEQRFLQPALVFIKNRGNRVSSARNMALQNPSHFPQSDVVVLERGEGTRVVVHLHGATVISWTCSGEEQLFLSSTSVFDNKKAIRGGIPVVFPNFGPWSLGPQHGFARIKRWTVAIPPMKDKNGDVIAAFSLEDDEETRGMWNFKFKLVYTLQLSEKSLVSSFVVHNTDKTDFEFTCLLHTYFRVPDIANTSVQGLKGLTYIDKVNDGKEFREEREVVTLTENYDRVYKDAPKTVVIQTAPTRRLQLSTCNLPDIVVWNPWEDKAKKMADFDDDGWRHMLCVEAGKVVSPVVLKAGDKFDSSQTFTLL